MQEFWRFDRNAVGLYILIILIYDIAGSGTSDLLPVIGP